jgi:hypothetical protein
MRLGGVHPLFSKEEIWGCTLRSEEKRFEGARLWAAA